MDILLAGSVSKHNTGEIGIDTLVLKGHQWTSFWQVLKVVGVLAGVLGLRY
jgi:hypothetical protein